MTNRKTLLALLALAASTGCSVSRPIDDVVVVEDERTLVPTLGPEPESLRPLRPMVLAESRLEECLAAGGELVEIASVDNNDQREHGALLTFGVSPSGVLAAAGEDGTLKFWTLDAELIGSVDGSLIRYGAEIGASPITDIAFMGEMAVVGDVGGLVQQMGADGAFGVLGGTNPDVPIIAVAFHEPTGRFAHAQFGLGWDPETIIPLAVRSVDGSTEPVDIGSSLEVIRDLAFAPNGELWVAGATGGAAAVEIRDASDPSVVARSIALSGAAPITEIALSSTGAIAALVASDFLYLVDGDEVRAIPAAEHAASSVAITRDGGFALSVGADGALVARASDDGREVARALVTRPITVRVDATDSVVLVGGQDAIIHAFSCEE